MKMPTLPQALHAIGALSGQGATIAAAESLVGIVVDLFDHEDDKTALKDKIAQVKAGTDEALDRLDAAIDERLVD